MGCGVVEAIMLQAGGDRADRMESGKGRANWEDTGVNSVEDERVEHFKYNVHRVRGGVCRGGVRFDAACAKARRFNEGRRDQL